MITTLICPWPWCKHGVIAVAQVAATIELHPCSLNAITILPSHADRPTMASQKVDDATEMTATTTADNKNAPTTRMVTTTILWRPPKTG